LKAHYRFIFDARARRYMFYELRAFAI